MLEIQNKVDCSKKRIGNKSLVFVLVVCLAALSVIMIIVTHITPARQRLGRHCLKAGIIAEKEVNLLGNGTQNTCFRCNEGIPVTTKRIRK
jgi:putative transposon-encoded protein